MLKSTGILYLKSKYLRIMILYELCLRMYYDDAPQMLATVDKCDRALLNISACLYVRMRLVFYFKRQI